jgi:hypothetical protein
MAVRRARTKLSRRWKDAERLSRVSEDRTSKHERRGSGLKLRRGRRRRGREERQVETDAGIWRRSLTVVEEAVWTLCTGRKVESQRGEEKTEVKNEENHGPVLYCHEGSPELLLR